MKAALLTAYGAPHKTFVIKDVPPPKIHDGEVLINVSAFGLNYADVMARRGIYNDAPTLPCILGYECVGKIADLGSGIKDLKIGQRVLAFTRFGAYAEMVKTLRRGVIVLEDTISDGAALALATQYCTAWYAAIIEARLRPGDHVLIHAAAGGVGTALLQIAKWRGCTVYACAGSDAKLEYLRQQGADVAINYRKEDYPSSLLKIRGKERFDVIFDPIGGINFKKNNQLLAYGGRLVLFGASARGKKGLWPLLKLLWGFGFHIPVGLIMKSQSWIGVNMLRIGDHKPALMAETIKAVFDLYASGILKPCIGGEFEFDKLADAHAFLESRNSTGKIIVKI